MSTELIFYTQIGSIIAFITAIFGLYRLLATQKDATIEALRERIALQLDRLAMGEPDALNKMLAKRVELVSKELERLGSDRDANAELIAKKEAELAAATAQFEPLQQFARNVSQLSMSYFCPVCTQSTLKSAECKTTFGYPEQSLFRVEYWCGYAALNGIEQTPCSGPIYDGRHFIPG